MAEIKDISGPVSCGSGAVGMDLQAYLEDQLAFSLKTYGPGRKTKSIINHIKREFIEIEGDPTSLEEWIDVAMLALDGAMRCAGPASTPELVCLFLRAKLEKNKLRQWPDWRTLPDDAPIEHIRSPSDYDATVTASIGQLSCPRCGAALDNKPIFIGNADEGHICGDCWVQDRHAEKDETIAKYKAANLADDD